MSMFLGHQQGPGTNAAAAGNAGLGHGQHGGLSAATGFGAQQQHQQQVASADDFAMLEAGVMVDGFDPLDMALPMDLDAADLVSMGMPADQGGGLMSLPPLPHPPQQQQQQQSHHPTQPQHPTENDGDHAQAQHQQQLQQGLSSHGDTITHSARPPESTVMANVTNNNKMSGAGAGPLPTGFGMPAQSNSSTLTEFTKRRNWSQRIIEELKDFLHILTPDGRILYVSPSCRTITGYEPHLLIGKFIGEYVHPDDSGIFMREFNESIASGNSLRFFYRFKKEDGTYLIFECNGHPHISPDPPGASQYNGTPDESGSHAGTCRGFFMMARPYPTKNAALLDSFLEHKIENERLMKRIEELKREEVEENEEQDRMYRETTTMSPNAGADNTTNDNNKNKNNINNNNNNNNDHQQGVSRDSAGSSEPPAGNGGGGGTPNYQGMPPPAKPSISNTALTRQNLDSALSSQKPDSIADKMSRYEANSTHLESIELLTGLRYRDGERSHGISTGDTSPALIRGDAGIAILLDRDREAAGKKEKKKVKVADEYVCADCGTLDSPEWRKGPKGPKTLCNACGLRWAKKEKKKGGGGSGEGGEGGGGRSGSPPLVGGAGGGGGLPVLAQGGGRRDSADS